MLLDTLLKRLNEFTPNSNDIITVNYINNHFTNIDIYIFQGDVKGNVTLITAGVHGDETPGIHIAYNIIEQLRKTKIRLGTIIVIPQVNPQGVSKMERYLQGADINRNFVQDIEPDSLLNFTIYLYHEIAKISNLVIDLHSNNPSMECLTHIRSNIDNNILKHISCPILVSEPYKDTIRYQCNNNKIDYIIQETGQGLIINKQETDKILYNIFILLDVKNKINLTNKEKYEPIYQKDIHNVWVEHNGIIEQYYISLGDSVKRNQKLFSYLDYHTGKSEVYYSPIDGTIMEVAMKNLVHWYPLICSIVY